MIKEWIFDSQRRMRWTVVGLAVGGLVLFMAVSLVRLAGLADVPQADPTTTAAPEPVSSALLPPSPAPQEASPTQTYGPSAPVALEAVSAFLLGDRRAFAALAQQQAVEAVNDAPVPPPGQEVTGSPTLVLPGPTRQQVSVPTTDGPILLDMVVVDGAWKVLDLRYAR
jgi:hypothetical protein